MAKDKPKAEMTAEDLEALLNEQPTAPAEEVPPKEGHIKLSKAIEILGMSPVWVRRVVNDKPTVFETLRDEKNRIWVSQAAVEAYRDNPKQFRTKGERAEGEGPKLSAHVYVPPQVRGMKWLIAHAKQAKDLEAFSGSPNARPVDEDDIAGAIAVASALFGEEMKKFAKRKAEKAAAAAKAATGVEAAE